MLLPSRQRAQKGAHESWRADRNRREKEVQEGITWSSVKSPRSTVEHV